MVKVLSDLQFDFQHKLPLESLSEWLKPWLIETEKMIKKLTKINEISKDSEKPINHNRTKSTKIAPVSQKWPKIYQN